MRLRSILAAATVAAGLAAASPAMAAKLDGVFIACDGYFAPTKLADNMLGNSVWGMKVPPRPILHAKVRYSPRAVANCDLALDQTPAEFWQRRINLLQARALHRLAGGDGKAALVDLDAARALARDDVFFFRSQGISLDLVRAYALRISGQQRQAIDLAMNVWRRRPYSRQITLGALAAMGRYGPEEDVDLLNRRLTALVPAGIAFFFQAAYDQGQFDQVVRLYPQLSAPREDTIGWQGKQFPEQIELNRLKELEYQLHRVGPFAYGLAATGHPQEAREALAEVAEPFQAAVSRPDTKAGWNTRVYELDANVVRGRMRGQIQDFNSWSERIEQRARLAEGRTEEVFAWAKTNLRPSDPADFEFVTALRKAVTPDQQAQLPTISAAARRRFEGRLAFTVGEFEDLVISLPGPERADRIVAFGPVGKPLFAMRGSIAETGMDGWRIEEWPGRADRQIMYRARFTAPAAIEEMALLRAAQYAREQGGDRFYLVARRDVQNEVVMQSYGTVVSRGDLAYESNLYVMPVKSGHTPLLVEPWRLLDVEAVIATLGPVYGVG